KYLTIYNELVNEIKSRNIKAGSLLPSENELKDTYNTSRETIRKALNLLSQNGYIQKMKSKCSTVINVNQLECPHSGLVSFKELAEKMGEEPKKNAHKSTVGKPDNYIQQQLQLTSANQVCKLLRTREMGGENIILYTNIPSRT